MSKEETTTEYFDLTPTAEASFDLLFEIAVNSPLSREWALDQLRTYYVRGLRSSLEG